MLPPYVRLRLRAVASLPLLAVGELVSPLVMTPVAHSAAAVAALLATPLLAAGPVVRLGSRGSHAVMAALAAACAALLAGGYSGPVALALAWICHVVLRLMALPHGLIMAVAAAQGGVDLRSALALDKLAGAATRALAAAVIGYSAGNSDAPQGPNTALLLQSAAIFGLLAAYALLRPAPCLAAAKKDA